MKQANNKFQKQIRYTGQSGTISFYSIIWDILTSAEPVIFTLPQAIFQNHISFHCKYNFIRKKTGLLNSAIK